MILDFLALTLMYQSSFVKKILKEIVIHAVILAVAHQQFVALAGAGVRAFGKPEGCVVYDVKGVVPREVVDARL